MIFSFYFLEVLKVFSFKFTENIIRFFFSPKNTKEPENIRKTLDKYLIENKYVSEVKYTPYRYFNSISFP